MTALAKDYKADQLGAPDEVDPGLLSFPVAASTATIWGGAIVATDTSGNAKGVTADPTLKIWGRCEVQVPLVAAVQSVLVRQGVFPYPCGTGVNAITAADVGKLCYASDDNTVNKTDGAGQWPAAGKIHGMTPDGRVYVGLGMTSLYDVNDELPGGNPANIQVVRARNVINNNVADLANYTVAANAANNDNVLGVAGDVVLLVKQTTAAQNGLYVIGTVGGGLAPLTRLDVAPAAGAFLVGGFVVHIAEGDLFKHSEWKNTAAGAFATNDPLFFPGRVVQEVVLVAGTLTLTNVPILSATKTAFSINRKVANTSTATTGGYVTNGAPTPGALGTASAAIMAAVAAGTINNADISTLEVAIINW